jgi:lysozyme
VKAFLDAVEKEAGCRPIIYTDSNFDDEYLDGDFLTEKFWARSIGWPPTYRSKSWVYWQYTELGERPGVDTPLDLDIFRGRPADFERFRKAAGCFSKSS